MWSSYAREAFAQRVPEDFGKKSFKNLQGMDDGLAAAYDWMRMLCYTGERRETLLHKLRYTCGIPGFLISSDEMFGEGERNLGAGRG